MIHICSHDAWAAKVCRSYLLSIRPGASVEFISEVADCGTDLVMLVASKPEDVEDMEIALHPGPMAMVELDLENDWPGTCGMLLAAAELDWRK